MVMIAVQVGSMMVLMIVVGWQGGSGDTVVVLYANDHDTQGD